MAVWFPKLSESDFAPLVNQKEQGLNDKTTSEVGFAKCHDLSVLQINYLPQPSTLVNNKIY